MKMTRAAYLASLPKRHAAAGALFFNDQDELLLLKPTYKDNWSLPGGVIDQDELPIAAACREVREEIGLSVDLKRLLIVDCMPPRPDKHSLGSYQFVFDGGRLFDDQIASIALCPAEIQSYSFVDADTALTLFGQGLSQRVRMALQARRDDTWFYLENGEISS